MAPALSATPRTFDSSDDGEKPLSHRRALASVDNLSAPMEEDDMGLQNHPSLVKDSQEMEQILVELGSSDLAPDLLQAIKTLEGGDGLSTGDTDAIFPLSGFDLTDTVESEGDAAEDKIRLIQARLERRCAFLQRRLRILQARAIGKRVSEEAAQTFEKCTRAARKDGGGRPMGLKAFLKRVETTAALQASAASRSVVGPKYYCAGTSKGDASRSASVGIPSGTLTGLEDTAGALRSHLSVVKQELDSDATASSSGAESNDEAVVYNNPHQQHMPIEKRALWSWQKARASIASRWCWLQAQVQELEYKIRQHNDLHKQVREAKGPVEFEGSPDGYRGSLPGAAPDPDPDPDLADTCARLRPLRRETFRKRKLLQMHNLHIATNKAAKPSDVRCSCQYGVQSCAVCTGRAEPTQPAPPLSTLSAAQRVASTVSGYHPVLSDVSDIPLSCHVSALCSRAWFRPQRAARGALRAPGPAPAPAPAAAPAPAHARARLVRRHPTRLKRGRPPLSRKIRERDREEDVSTPSGQERSRGRASTDSRRRPSYDIDNIVIPQSVAANTRPQILTYKEIITPKWRLLEIPEVPMNNGVSRSSRMTLESEEEDVSENAVSARHLRAEHRERARYLRAPRRRRRLDTDTGDVTLRDVTLRDDTLRHDMLRDVTQRDEALGDERHEPPATVEPQETVRPYTPRQFPLPEDMYMDMLSVMPDGFRPSSPEPTPPPLEEEDSSTLSPMSPLIYDGDDPDDVEWDPSSEKAERRKSAFR